MQKELKKLLNKWFVIGIIGLICLVFVFVGVFPTATSMLTLTPNTRIAEVGDEGITVAEYQQQFNRQMQAYKAFGDKIPPFLLQNLQQSVLQSLVSNKILRQEAKRMGIAVSHAELAKEIQAIPAFQNKETKKFDIELYRRLLKANNLETGSFEENVRSDLVIRKLMASFQARIRVTDDEVRREFELVNDKRNLEFIHLNKDYAGKQIQISDSEKQKWLAVPQNLMLAENYFKKNERKFRKDDREEEFCYRQILRSQPKNDGSIKMPSDFEKLRPTSSNFAAMARKHSDDKASKSKGGDLGCVKTSAINRRIYNQLLKTPLNTVSGKIISTNLGWHYILPYKKIENKSTAWSKSNTKLNYEIAEILIKESRFTELMTINRRDAKKFATDWESGRKPKKSLLKQTGEFSRMSQAIPQIGRANEILEASFDPSAKIQKGPQIFEAPGGVIVAKVKSSSSPDFSKFEAEKAKQLRTLQARKFQAFQQTWMTAKQKEYAVKIDQNVLKQLSERR